MSNAGSGRVLTPEELVRVANSKEARDPAVKKWPEFKDLLTIAKAVKQHSVSVKLNDDKWYSIRYDSRYKAIFIKPAGAEFVPCGYISYDKIKIALENSEHDSHE